MYHCEHFNSGVAFMNVRIAILKVLSSYPDGRASYAALKFDLEMLSTREWLDRMRDLGARAGAINIFSEKLATRDADGWTITQAGRAFLDRLERGEEIKRPEELIGPPARTLTEASPLTPSKQVQLKLVKSA